MDPIKVGKFIASLRREKNMTQEELAEKINVSNKTVSKWEVGVNVPDTNCLYLLSKEFNVPTQDILNGGEIHNESENNASIKNGINFYNKLFKRKILKISLLVIIGIIVAFSMLYTISNYNKVQVYDISSSVEDFAVNGYLIFNLEETIFVVNDIKYVGSMGGINISNNQINYYYISVENKDKKMTYYYEDSLLDVSKSLNEILNNIKISFTINNDEYINVKNKNIDDCYINIFYTHSDNNEVEYKIKLNFKKHFSNTKIVY